MENVVEQPLTMQEKVAEMRRGANWFLWIAVLGVINTLLVTFSTTGNMLFELGGTRLIDSLLRENTLAPVNTVGVPINLAIAGLFAAFGYFARQGRDKLFALGIFLYVVDAIILIGFGAFFSFCFHLVALFFLVKGLLASRKRFDPSV